jgi:DNA-directed RNA polymerase subunit F
MITKQDPTSMAEVKSISKEDNPELEKFIKGFVKMKPEEAEKFKEELEALGLIKMKPENIVKIIDLLPEDASDINKIFTEAGLDESEINKILEVVKKHR